MKSNIKNIVESVYEQDHVTVPIGKDKTGREKLQAGANLAALLKDLEREMRERTPIEYPHNYCPAFAAQRNNTSHVT